MVEMKGSSGCGVPSQACATLATGRSNPAEALDVFSAPSSEPEVASFANAPQEWEALHALLRSPRRSLSWARAGSSSEADVRRSVEKLAKRLGGEAGPIALEAGGYALRSERFIFLFPGTRLPASEQSLLAVLADQPGASAGALAAACGLARRTTVTHLARLRAAGFVRRVGGGSEARYRLV